MSETPRRRADLLAEKIGVDHRGRIPRDVSLSLADRLFAAVVAGADDGELRTIAGSISYQDGYRRARLCDFDFSQLQRLVLDARRRLGGIDRQIAELRSERAAIEEFLRPATTDEPETRTRRRKSR